MNPKGVLLDIDNTLYDYEPLHLSAMKAVWRFCGQNFNLPLEEVRRAFQIARQAIHVELAETASSHNRFLYFQRMLEILGLNTLEWTAKLYDCYWDHFLDHLKMDSGAPELLTCLKDKSVCLLTDLTSPIQHRKAKKLALLPYVDAIVTSEEAGREKPHPYIFMLALNKLKLSSSDVVMIGDNYKKDILGAHQLGIRSIWLNRGQPAEGTHPDGIVEIHSLEQVVDHL